MTLEEAKKIRDLLKEIEELKEFSDFIRRNKEEYLSIESNDIGRIGCKIDVPKVIAESLATLSETILVSLEGQLKNL